jgi:xylan 1,4-beta-xylosidase
MNDVAPATPLVSTTTIKNPILRGFYPDPSVSRVGDDYYIATSTFEWYPGVQILHSRNLQDWALVARPLREARLLELSGVPDSCGIWAPCLTHADGKFWLCYTVVRRFAGNFKDAHNYLTTCDTVDGEWSDPVYMNSSGFDPSLFHDDDGRKWHINMVWDHRPNRSRFGGIVLQEYSVAETCLVGTPSIIFTGSETGLTEGPHLYKHDGLYYLMTAEGGTGYEHAVTLARAKNIQGPYEIDPQTHVMTAVDKPDATLQRTGHASLVDTPDGKWYLAHLCSRPIAGANRRSVLGRETALQAVTWDAGGWLRLLEPETAYVAATSHPLLNKRYDFGDEALADDFQWLRTAHSARLFSTTARTGFLRLIGRESIGSLFESSLVARRQQHFNYVAETKLEFAPENFQQMAGLVAYYNSHKFHYLYITREEDSGRQLCIMSCCGDPSLDLNFPALHSIDDAMSHGPLWLRCKVEGVALQFSFSTDGEKWLDIGPQLDASVLSDEAGSTEHANFTGAFVGMACQDISGQALHADFEYFEYREF